MNANEGNEYQNKPINFNKRECIFVNAIFKMEV